MKDPTLSKIFLDQMIEPVGSTPAAFEAFLRAEHDKWGKVIKDAKLDAAAIDGIPRIKSGAGFFGIML